MEFPLEAGPLAVHSTGSRLGVGVHRTRGLPFCPTCSTFRAVNAAEIIAKIRDLPPAEFAEVSAFILSAEREDPACQSALQRKLDSTTGQVVSRPYEQARASVRASLNPAQ